MSNNNDDVSPEGGLSRYTKNKHGVEGYWSHSGSMFGRYFKREDGTKYFRTCNPIFVPRVCIDCKYFDIGEFGDYGELLGGPLCERNLRFPTRKGTCKAKR